MKKVVEIIDVNLIYCLIPIILTLFFIQIIFKNRFETTKALNLVRWIIIVYTVFYIISIVVGTNFFVEMNDFLDRATGPYKFTYWFILISSTILPFTLLIKKLSTSKLFLLTIAFLMKVGLYFEQYVIIVTSIHRDYMSSNATSNWKELVAFSFAMIMLQGFILAILMLFYFEVFKKWKMNKRFTLVEDQTEING